MAIVKDGFMLLTLFETRIADILSVSITGDIFWSSLANANSKNIDLVELNLKSNSEGVKEITVLNKNQTRKEIKVLSNDEIERKKIELKKRKKIKSKKIKDKKITKQAKLKKTKKKQKPLDSATKTKKIVNKPGKKITDICTILEKCSIDEISKYLVKQGKKKRFPDITTREN